MEDVEQEDDIWRERLGVRGREGGPRAAPGREGSVTLCDDNGVLQVGQQRVLVVTLVAEKHQVPGGEREGTPELGLT